MLLQLLPWLCLRHALEACARGSQFICARVCVRLFVCMSVSYEFRQHLHMQQHFHSKTKIFVTILVSNENSCENEVLNPETYTDVNGDLDNGRKEG